MTVYAVGGREPEIDGSAWVAREATVVGHVKLAEEVSVWFGAVIRGDQPEPCY